jgi:cytochrome c biogenesis protein
MIKNTQRVRKTLWQWLGSMDLAILLLVTLAIGSVIGTVLLQNQPYSDYLLKFGPFWFDVFKQLGLFDVYKSLWFMAILGFLVLSTSVCVVRNTPAILRDMRLRSVTTKSLKAFHHQKQWVSPLSAEVAAERLSDFFQQQHFRTRQFNEEDNRLVSSANKGVLSRLGYIATHAGIVIICVGALIDGNMALKWQELTGNVHPETRNIPAAEVPKKSWLPVDSSAFRVQVSIPEGDTARVAFLPTGPGYLVQPLPFSITVKDFRMEHYASGQPKSFESDLVLDDGEQKIEKTIAVNHPLVYKDYAIYQSSFADGGSQLQIQFWPLHPAKPLLLDTAVNETVPLASSGETITLEIDDFRLFNITPNDEETRQATGKKFTNSGPSFRFKVRKMDGSALEYDNYMVPVTIGGKQVLLSGVRSSPAEPFRYLHIPVDSAGSANRFLQFARYLMDSERLDALFKNLSEDQLVSLSKNKDMDGALRKSMRTVLHLFRNQGFDGLEVLTNQAPIEERGRLFDLYMRVLRHALGLVYIDVLQTEDDFKMPISEADSRFFEEATLALGGLVDYQSPFYLQLNSFKQVQATGLQITHAPGQPIVYLGCFLLIVGVFLMFYVPYSRYWGSASPTDQGSVIVFAGTFHRQNIDTDDTFNRLATEALFATEGE